MFEFHGWATLSEGVCEEDDDGALLDRIVETVQSKIAEWGSLDREVGLRWLNGAPMVWLAGQHNHANGDVVNFFRLLASLAPGAYGLLYVWDDEGETPNAFRVWVLRRGRLEQREDVLLSPCAPTIEDG